ncbi:hypothetical protein [Yinghuangia soli]|nr:hypothetical protein [Yinghuangia soli]
MRMFAGAVDPAFRLLCRRARVPLPPAMGRGIAERARPGSG